MGYKEFLYLPLVTSQWLIHKFSGRYPTIPWWTFRAIERIDSLVHQNWRVIEFGSGYSTLWLAKKVQHVTAIEDDENWYQWIRERCKIENIGNVSLLFRENEMYWNTDDFQNSYFHLAIIDGHHRANCVKSVLKNIIEGGYIYLDNADVNDDASSALKEVGHSVEYYRGMAPRMLFAQTGMLVRVGEQNAC